MRLLSGRRRFGFLKLPFSFLHFRLYVEDYIRRPSFGLGAKMLDAVGSVSVDAPIVEHEGDVLANVQKGFVGEEWASWHPRGIAADERSDRADGADREATVVLFLCCSQAGRPGLLLQILL